MVPIDPSQVQNVLVGDAYDIGMVMLAEVTRAVVLQPVLLQVSGSLQCLKRVL